MLIPALAAPITAPITAPLGPNTEPAAAPDNAPPATLIPSDENFAVLNMHQKNVVEFVKVW